MQQTTSAFLCRALLAPIEFATVMLEEAAEINEAPVLAALPRSVERLVMIGDHKQLRPQINSFKLQVRTSNVMPPSHHE